jgi:uncharacterized membrane protein YphA (DoxX/SURF4 family)
MTKRNIGYWASTGLLALAFAAGGLFDLSGAPAVAEGMSHLGYPVYFALILGAWKVLGALAVLAPGMPRLKEWAYAGIVFDLSGAALSHAFAGDAADKLLAPVVLLAVAVASWALRPASRVLGARAAFLTSDRPAHGTLAPRTA